MIVNQFGFAVANNRWATATNAKCSQGRIPDTIKV
jgi:hypothetical protein